MTIFFLLTLLNVNSWSGETSDQIFYNIDQSSSSQAKPHFMPKKLRSVDKTTERNKVDPLSEITPGDRPEQLVDQYQVSAIQNMETMGLRRGVVSQQPWSGSYWPTYLGSVARRYTDISFPNSGNWQVNAEYLWNNIAKGSIDKFSPAEKYDLLVGDPKFSLTQKTIQGIYQQAGSTGKIEAWFGLCHGWAPASYMMARPEKDVIVLAADGVTQIRFRPTDIKALATMLWANGESDYRMIGSRCNDNQVETDPYGRPLKQSCLDSNPGTWHLALVNQIGLQKRSLVFDATYTVEVWNQPIVSYEYSYFNPKTNRTVKTLEEALVRNQDFTNDPVKPLRSLRTAFVAGVSMKVYYTLETEPNSKPDQGPSTDKITSKLWHYDLELDANGNIVGGEWYQKERPDFLWTPTAQARVHTNGDRYLDRLTPENWAPGRVMPESWKAAAQYGSSYNQPLRRIVETLVEYSKKP